MKLFIKNRHGQKVRVVVEGPETPGKLAFVMHGLGGNKKQGHIRAMIEGFLEEGYTVVSFDTTNTFGESDGKYEDATITGYYADLEDVIDWASQQPWYIEPFVLCGHSLGGISVILFAEAHPKKVQALAPISTVVTGALTLEWMSKDELDNWEKTGVHIELSHSGKHEKRLPWSHVEDRLTYDILPEAHKLTMPVLMAVGERDGPTPPKHQKLLYDILPGQKEFHIINGALHSFYEPSEQNELKQIVRNWLHTVNAA